MEKNELGKVSVVVPVYNGEKYIGTCVDSLASQTYENIEIILVDDGSTDRTRKICEEYRQHDQTLIQVIHSEHSGVTNARILGVRKAAGEFLAFVDADDWVEEDYISSMLSCMAGADIIAAGITREQMNEAGSTFYECNGIAPGIYSSEPERKILYEHMLYLESPYQFGVLPYLCNKIFRKALLWPFLERMDKEIFDGEDVAVVYPCLLAAGKVVLTDECGYHYRNHGDSVSFKDSGKAYWNVCRLYQWLYACFQESPYCGNLMRQLDYYTRRMIWKKDPAGYLSVNSFVFPFGKVKAGSRIILYGMGKMGVALYQQLERVNYCELAAWADRNPDQPGGKRASVARIFPNEIPEYLFDYIVIGIQNEKIVETVEWELYTMGIPKQKIIRA